MYTVFVVRFQLDNRVLVFEFIDNKQKRLPKLMVVLMQIVILK